MTGGAATFEEALEHASSLLATDPAAAFELANRLAVEKQDARAFRLVAAALRALDQHEAAEQAEIEGINSGFAQPLRLARAAQQARRSGEAKSLAEDYLRDHPDDLLAMTVAAEAVLALGHADQAEPMLRQVVARAPGFPPASLLLATIVAGQLRLHEAAQILEGLLERAPQQTGAKRFLADLRTQMNDPSGAAMLYQDIVASGQTSAVDQLKYAQALRVAGARTESIDAFRRAIDLSPFDGHAWSALAHFFPEELTKSDERQIRTAVASRALQPDDLRLMHVVVSILDHRRGDYQAAFEAIAAAKALPSRTPEYDPDSLSRHVDELIAAYTPELFAGRKSQASQSDAAIFIVGMPRSGSTLVERVLGQHSKIEAIGEIPVMPRLIAAEQPRGTASYRSLLPQSLTVEKLSEMAEWYLERSHEYRHTDKPRFTDKYNGNWIRAGLIRLMLPNARIIDVRRNALDCCWGVFRTMFVDDYARDQRHLAHYYADYVRFIDAVAAASPDGILTVRYEDIVTDLEGQIRQILKFLGLEFEPACLDFHLSSGAVATPSSEQVRRPVNRDSIGSAEPYRRWLQPLIAELESALGSNQA